MPDLDVRIRALIDTARPVQVDEVIGANPRLRANRRLPWKRTAVALIAVAAVVIAVALLAGHNASRTKVSIEASPTQSAPAPTNTTVSVPETAGLSVPPLAGCLTDTQQASGPRWKCPVSPGEADKVIGANLPDPTVPAGYLPSYQPFLWIGPGPTRLALYQRTWTPKGAFSDQGVTGAFLELRVQIHQWTSYTGPPNPDLTLANGVIPTGKVGAVFWTHAGLDYELESTQIPSTQVIATANSLP